MVKRVSESALKRSHVDLNKTFFSLTASIICRVALGLNFHESGFVIGQDGIEKLGTEAGEVLGTFTFSDFFPGALGSFVDWLFQRHKKINRVVEELDAFYQRVIDEHLKPEGRKNQDIVSLMLDMIDKQGSEDYFKLNMDNVKAILMDIFLAGIDTGATTMIWAMTELVRNPNVMKKAQENIRATLGLKRKRITEEDLGKVDYMTFIIKETFRLHPPVPFLLPRETMTHVKIQGYDIPPKTQIKVNVWTIGRDPERWTDPEEFMPERFADSSVDFRGQHFELLPFGSGRRICPAVAMGTATVELGLMNLLYFFDWGLPDGMHVEELDIEEADNPIFILLCIFLVLLLTLVSSIFLKRIKNSKFSLPPGPSSLPIIGNLHHLAGLPHRCFHNLSIKYGPVVLLRLGFVPVVVISSSEAAEAVLKTHDLECCSRPKTVGTGKLSYGFKDITFSQYGAYWREMRKLAVIELFSLKKVQSFRSIREDEVGFLVKKLSELALTRSPVDLSKTFFSLTASIICRVALGQNFHESDFFIDQEKIEELVTEAADALGAFTFSDFFPGVFGRFLDLLFQRHKRINNVFKELDAFYQHVIDDHLKPEGRKNPDIVSMMLDMIDEQGSEDSFKLNMDNVKAILMDVFIAGIDTSAVTMIWAMAELVKNPRVMKKAQENIRTTLGVNRETITEDDIGKVDYLKLIIKETFRLHPALPFIIPRETMSHVKIQGYDIPAKTQIQINVWTIGRDPERWTDPEEFKPERFTDSSVDFRGQHFDLLPFGSGRRMCPAMPMGVANVELTLMNLLYFFDWGLPDGMKVGELDMEEAGNISIAKKIPLQLVPLRRY
ncbi:hypothetical protein Bca52824_013149 [Brassica carinata]|uniref:Cytochrome P450 71B2 n=1 Tax=Brassica carinata TaxID=52824 RepID=A0A8X7VYE4_BRACI|nr:hypothetical protein Bca52824_013149 [Brassica carinata]